MEQDDKADPQMFALARLDEDRADLIEFELAMREHRYDDALRIALEAHEEFRDDLNCFLAIGRAYYRTNQFSEALYWMCQLNHNLWDEARETGLTQELSLLYVNSTALFILAQYKLNQMNPEIAKMDDLAISGPSFLGPAPNRARQLPIDAGKAHLNALAVIARQLMEADPPVPITELGLFFDACEVLGVRIVD
ncbi:MAG TPA: hypothetical protein VFO38_00360 [Candidatus Saccharimonadales bacterium]|nr:hypothetical protein [Candidatus Saccharimonadales bacterium]